MKLLFLVGICSCLSGCALTLEMMAISGISYLATGKSLSDNAFSMVTNKDCALHRIIINESVCLEDPLPPVETTPEFLLADSNIKDTIKTQVTSVQGINDPVADFSADVAATYTAVSMHDFSVSTEATSALATEYSSTQIFAVVGSFNNYQFAQQRHGKYQQFNPQIIENQPDSSTKYRVVVGPVNNHNFIAELPVMVGAETQLPWEIELCGNDMSPPPCNYTYAANNHKQSTKWTTTPNISEGTL